MARTSPGRGTSFRSAVLINAAPAGAGHHPACGCLYGGVGQPLVYANGVTTSFIPDGTGGRVRAAASGLVQRVLATGRDGG